MKAKHRRKSTDHLADFIARLAKADRDRRRQRSTPRTYVVLFNPVLFPDAWLPTTVDATDLLVPIFNIDPADGERPTVAVFPSRRLARLAIDKSAAVDPRGREPFALAQSPTQPKAQGGAK